MNPVLRLVLPLLLVAGVGLSLSREAGRVRPPVIEGGPDHGITEEGRLLQRPALTVLDGGRALLVYLQHELGAGDRLMARELDRERVGAPVAIQDRPGQLLRPVIAGNAAGQPQAFWTELTDRGPRLFTAWRDGGAWTRPAELDTGPGPSFNVVAARGPDGSPWLAWQQFVNEPDADGARGHYQVVAARCDGTRLGPRAAVTSDAANHWDPTLAASGGRMWFAWAQAMDRDYEVMARSLDLTADTWSKAVNVSRDTLADDLHPALGPGADGEVWIAWDSAYDPARGRSGLEMEPQRPFQEGARLRLACLVDGEPRVLPGDASGFVPAPRRLSWSGALPAVAARGPGVLIAHRFLNGGLDGPSHDYPVLVQTFDGASWGDAVALEKSGGAPEELALAATQDGVWIAWQQDPRARHGGLPLSAPPVGDTRELLEARGICLTGQIGESSLGVAWRPWPEPAGPPTLQPLQAEARVRDHPWRDPEHDPIVRGDQHLEVEAGDTTYRVYWGDLHRHSCMSRCSHGMEPRPEQRYAFGHDLERYDFYALTDHSGHLGPFQWWQQGKLLDLFQTPTFCTLQGYEWSSPDYGHQNVILRGRRDQISSTRHPGSRTPELLWQRLPEGQALTIPHHSSLDSCPTDWQQDDPAYLRLVEVFQAMRGNFEFEDCYRQARKGGVPDRSMQDGLMRGLRFGLIASTDHGSGAAYAAVLAEELTRDSIFEALYARRTYGATTKGMLVDFRVDGHLMGEEVVSRGDPVVELHAMGTAELAEVTVFRDGEVWQRVPQRTIDKNVEHLVELTIEPPPAGPAADLRVTLAIDKGRFVADELGLGPDAARQGPRWSQPDLRAVELVWPAGYAGEWAAADRRVRLRARDESVLEVRVNDETRDLVVGAIRGRRVGGERNGLRWVLRCRVNEDKQGEWAGLGTREFQQRWVDDAAPDGDAWYYARVIQKDGEMAWSSPVFVQRPR